MYTRKISENEEGIKSLKIGFFLETEQTEHELRNKEFLFRENLNISEEDLKAVVNLSMEQRIQLIENEFKLQLKINGKSATIKDVSITKIGILIDFVYDYEISDDSYSIDIGFKMPQMKGDSQFLASISEPTFEPTIIFTYDTSLVNVVAYQFLNADSQLVDNSELIKGQYIVRPREWIFPARGVLFIINSIV